MRNKISFYSCVITGAICLLGTSAFGATVVRALGNSGNTVVGATNTDALKNAQLAVVPKTGLSATAVNQTNRASSLRFAPTVSSATVNTPKQYNITTNNNTASGSVAISPSSRLSIGKYLNLSHSNTTVPAGGTTPAGGTATCTACADDLDALRQALEEIRARIEAFNLSKQNTLEIGAQSSEIIEITGADNNIINIDIDALKQELQEITGGDRDVVTELDSELKLWWCYADDATAGASGMICNPTKRRLIVDLGGIDLANGNTSISTALENIQNLLAGKQKILQTTDTSYISVDASDGTIGVELEALREALNIPESKIAEIRVNSETGILEWRYTDQENWTPLVLPYLTQDGLAAAIESSINTALENLRLPAGPDTEGLYLLSVTGDGSEAMSTWHPVEIIDAAP